MRRILISAATDLLFRALQEYPNLVVMQTFSKAWGLAGLRLGMAFASEAIIEVYNRVKPPYNINQVTQELVLKALEEVGQVNDMIKLIVQMRGRTGCCIDKIARRTKSISQ